jgi:octaprenyl-diphosphate synthase
MDRRLLITAPLQAELDIFNAHFKNAVFSAVPRIQAVIEQVMKSDGKKIRPLLMLLAAKFCGEVNVVTYNSAVTVELLHTASLIHDDVVDESFLRRGKPSLNAVYDNKIAVLTGDYFLSTALIKSVLTGNIRIIETISNLGRSLAEGELNQLSLVHDNVIDEAEYFEVIKKKTASLLSICMKIGAISVGASEDLVIRFETLGEYIGMCFQLRDDVFDYFTTNDVGKPTGNDIRDGKVTLPLLYALRNNKTDESDCLLQIIRDKDFSEENIARLIAFAKENGGIDYANQKLAEYKEKACEIIDSLPNNELKTTLYQVVEYVIEREY